MLAVNRRGTMFMGIATDKGLYEQPGELTGTAENALLRSRNDGRTWRRIPLPGGINASEGFPYVDPGTDRLFVTSLSADVTRCGQPVIYSDDEGEHWTEAAGRPGCSPATLGDWPKIFAGPHRVEPPGGYPNAVYVCNFIPNILVAASIGCWRSDDGGDHFEFTSFLPTVNGACKAGDEQGGTGATIVHGSGRVLANGVVVVPLTVCGEPMVVRSRDEGQTWTAVSHRRRQHRPRRHRRRATRAWCSGSPTTSGRRTSPSTTTTTCSSPTSPTAACAWRRRATAGAPGGCSASCRRRRSGARSSSR